MRVWACGRLTAGGLKYQVSWCIYLSKQRETCDSAPCSAAGLQQLNGMLHAQRKRECLNEYLTANTFKDSITLFSFSCLFSCSLYIRFYHDFTLFLVVVNESFHFLVNEDFRFR
jgi:hypothetical protein